MINYLINHYTLSLVLIAAMGTLLIWVLCNMDEVEEVKLEEVKLYKEIGCQER